MVLLKSLLINYHYLVNALIIFVNILIYVGSSIENLDLSENSLNQYLDFFILDKLLKMLIFYPSYVVKHFFLTFKSAYLVLKVWKLLFHYVKNL